MLALLAAWAAPGLVHAQAAGKDDELEELSPAPPASTSEPEAPEVDTDLLDAFTPPPPSEGGTLTHAPPDRAPKWTAPPASVREEASPAALAALDKLERAIAQKRWPDAQLALAPALTLARGAGPHAQQRAYEAACTLAAEQKNERALLRAVTGLLHACGPTSVDACRKRAWLRLAGGTFPAAARERLRQFEREIRRSDACLAGAEAQLRAGSAAPPAPCLGTALKGYRKSGDRLMVARVLYVEALAPRAEGKAQHMQRLAAAQRACPEERCEALRARILHAMVPLYVDAKDPRAGVQLLLKEIKRSSVRGGHPSSVYLRTAELDAACESLESAEAGLRCHALEKSALGHYIFRDYSREQVPGKGLTPAVVQKVSRQYGVLLEQCLTEESQRQEHPDSARFAVHWMVRNDGHVDQVHLDSKDADASPLGECFRSALSVWRYPRYAGEFQHVDQEFEVHVVTRRAAE